MGKAEGKIESYLRNRCKEEGYMCCKFTSPGYDGVPDRVCIGHNVVFFVETKAPGEKPRKLQIEVIKTMREFGGSVYVADTEELVEAILKDVKNMPGWNQTPVIWPTLAAT